MRSVTRVVIRSIGEKLVEALAAEKRTPEDIASIVQPPRLANLTRLLRVVNSTRGVGAHCTAFTSDQVYQQHPFARGSVLFDGVLTLHSDVGVIDNNATRPVVRRRVALVRLRIGAPPVRVVARDGTS